MNSYPMQELYEEIKGNDSNLIIIRDIIYSSSCTNYIPLLQMDDQGIIWVFLNAQVINDLKRLIKRLDRMGMQWFYRTTGVRFDADMYYRDTVLDNYKHLIRFACRVESWNFEIHHNNMVKLKVLDKIIEMGNYFKHNSELYNILDCFTLTRKPHHYSTLNTKPNYLYDPDGTVEAFKRSLLILSIIE